MTSLATTDLADFLRLPDTVQNEVRNWEKLLATIQPPIMLALRGVATQLGVSYECAREKYYAWRRARKDDATSAWRVLINHAKAPARRSLDPLFLEWWCKLCQENSRSHLAAYREFVRRFRRGDDIPGIPHGTNRSKLPRGMTYENLMRHKPTKFETRAARIGRSAAADFRPKVLTDRKGLEVGRRRMWDDMWHDFKVSYVGQRAPRRLIQLHGHDLASACQFIRGMKPMIEDPETGGKLYFKNDEVLFLMAAAYTEFGYHPDGTIEMMEHGTTTVREEIERKLFDLTKGKITFDRGGIEGAAAFAGQYAGRSKGNFRFKASLESLGNLIHNETANLLAFPGQTGSNSRLNLPEELAGRERHAITLELALLALPPELRVKLRLPFLECNEAMRLVNEVMERINRRTEHELQGWIECGHVTTDLILPVGDGTSVISQERYLSLDTAQRAAIDAIASPAVRKLSPREVFDAGRKRLIRFRSEQIAFLLKDVQGGECTVGDDHLITIQNQEVSPSPIHYEAHTRPAGTKFRYVVNPFTPGVIYLFDARGAWMGTEQEWGRTAHDDIEGLHAQMGRAAHIEKQLLAPLAARGREITQQRLADSQNNIAVLEAHANPPLTPAEKEVAAIRKKYGAGSGAGDDLLDALCSHKQPKDKQT